MKYKQEQKAIKKQIEQKEQSVSSSEKSGSGTENKK